MSSLTGEATSPTSPAGSPGTHWRLPARRPGHEPSPELAAMRAGGVSVPTGSDTVAVHEEVLDGVPCMVCAAAGASTTLVYFHGGGYRIGSARSVAAGVGLRLAAAATLRVVLADYALAPEQPFPAALHDAATVYQAAGRRWSDPVAVGGESAGGGLAAALVLAARASAQPLPVAVVLVSPWLDLTVSAASYRRCAGRDELFSATRAQGAAGTYLQGWDAADPLASPLFGELGDFPPTLLLASTDEVLCDDTRAFGAALARAGGSVTTRLVPGVPHVWPTVRPDMVESGQAVATIAAFLSGR